MWYATFSELLLDISPNVDKASKMLSKTKFMQESVNEGLLSVGTNTTVLGCINCV